MSTAEKITSSSPIAFVDCETTGVHPGRRPWEIAIIRREPDGTEETCHLQVDDVDLSNADPLGLRIGGFYKRHWSVGGDPGRADVMLERDVAVFVERFTRNAHLVGAVPNFDAETFDVMLRRHRLSPAWHYHLIDVEALAVGYLSHAGQAIELPWKSDDLCRACGVEPANEEDRHTALGDALWVKRWYDAIIGGKQMPA
jgi:DNA polymerase III epsilon subunit-like protein